MKLRLLTVSAVMALMASCQPAHADTIGVHTVSLHVPAYDYNNVNPGVYYRHEGWTVGTYFNSLKNVSVYAGYTLNVYGPVDVTVGAITGYRHDVQPLLVPSVRLPALGGFTPRLAYIPKIEAKEGAHVLHLMIERGF